MTIYANNFRISLNSSVTEISNYKDLIDITSLSTHSQIENVTNENTYYTINRNYEGLEVSEANDNAEEGLNYNYVAYETVVTETDEDNQTRRVDHGNDEQTNVTSNKNIDVTKDENIKFDQKSLEYASKETIEYLPDSNIEFSGYIQFNSGINEDVNDCKHIKDTNDEEIAECDMESTLDNSSTCNVEVQTSEDINTTRYPLVPVFDVYMKDGNVTGFVVKDDVLHNLKQVGIEKGVQTNKAVEW